MDMSGASPIKAWVVKAADAKKRSVLATRACPSAKLFTNGPFVWRSSGFTPLTQDFLGAVTCGRDHARMAGQLISIALTVDQHDDGDYFWVLLESFDHSMEFEPLMEAATGFASYADALQAGYAVLRGLSDDLGIGPREDDEEPDVVSVDDDDQEDLDPRHLMA